MLNNYRPSVFRKTNKFLPQFHFFSLYVSILKLLCIVSHLSHYFAFDFGAVLSYLVLHYPGPKKDWFCFYQNYEVYFQSEDQNTFNLGTMGEIQTQY